MSYYAKCNTRHLKGSCDDIDCILVKILIIYLKMDAAL
jgi:hypothetical protein